jgi:hypothetical protein
MKYQPSIKGEIFLEEQREHQSWIGKTERDWIESCSRDAGIIENGHVIYSPDMARLEIKNKLSSLRGKHTKQTEQEIDDQII